MAKSARASSRKNNNQKLKANVFGPVEDARTERLAAKLMELVAQAPPKPAEAKKNADAMDTEPTPSDQLTEEASAMDIDARPSKKALEKKRVQKRKSVKKGSIVFARYSDRAASKKRK